MKQWSQQPEDIGDKGDILADAISDLNTENNCISTWHIENEEDLNKAILALVSGFKSLDSIKIVLLDYQQLSELGMVLQESDGLTKVETYKKMHIDIAELNLNKIGTVARCILDTIWNGNIRDIQRDKVGHIIIKGLNDGLLEFSQLEKGMKSALAAFVIKQINKKNLSRDQINDNVFQTIEEQNLLNKKKTNCQFEMSCGKYGKVS